MFDPTDYTTPVKTYLEETYISLDYNRVVMTNFFFRMNEVHLDDDYIGWFGTTVNDKFYQKSKAEY